jgi:hypothetical protein
MIRPTRVEFTSDEAIVSNPSKMGRAVPAEAPNYLSAPNVVYSTADRPKPSRMSVHNDMQMVSC